MGMGGYKTLGVSRPEVAKKTREKYLQTSLPVQSDSIISATGWQLKYVSLKTPEIGLKIVQRFVDIVHTLKIMGNYNGMMEVWSGLMRGPVHRMKQTFKALSKKYTLKITEIEHVSDCTGNHRNLRECIKSADPPIIPYLGMYLTDMMTFIEEGNKTIISVQHDDKNPD